MVIQTSILDILKFNLHYINLFVNGQALIVSIFSQITIIIGIIYLSEAPSDKEASSNKEAPSFQPMKIPTFDPKDRRKRMGQDSSLLDPNKLAAQVEKFGKNKKI